MLYLVLVLHSVLLMPLLQTLLLLDDLVERLLRGCRRGGGGGLPHRALRGGHHLLHHSGGVGGHGGGRGSGGRGLFLLWSGGLLAVAADQDRVQDVLVLLALWGKQIDSNSLNDGKKDVPWTRRVKKVNETRVGQEHS